MTQEQVTQLRQAYENKRVEIIKMLDSFSPVPNGTRGTVTRVDDIGQIHVNWDNGSTLALVSGIDEFNIITNE